MRFISLCLVLVLGASALAQRPARSTYVDPAQLDVPWPKHSFMKVPWRAFLETRSGDDFLRGIGVVYNVPGQTDLAVRLLAETGFKAFRIEVAWGSVRWDENGINDDGRLLWLLKLCKKYSIRPTLLLNAHHGVPCPQRSMDRMLADNAAKGSRSVKLTDTNDIVPGHTGISNVTDYWGAEVLITSVNRATGQCELSRPLPKELKKGQKVPLMTLKYLPLHPVGSKEFDDTAAGWVRYALLVCKQAHDAGLEEFDVEIWNELTFGTHFLNINDYCDPRVAEFKKDILHEGGQLWELGRRTVAAVKRDFPPHPTLSPAGARGARCIWGFSNTTFFHTQVDQLPTGTDGQSFHPYGTGTRRLPQEETHRGQPALNLDGFTPSAQFRISEGWAHTFIQTESLMRLLNPEARRQHPPGVGRFYRYITEHGVVPAECGVHDEAGGWRLKTLCALRSYCLWLNKGVDVLHYYCAHEENAQGMGLLPAKLKSLPADAKFDTVATPPMKAVRNLTRAFGGSVPLAKVQSLSVELTALDKPGRVFDGAKSLSHADVFAFLPFQVNKTKHVVAVYVSTYDAAKVMPPERYRLKILGFAAFPRRVRLYDPVTERSTPLEITRQGEQVQVDVEVVDYPRLLILEQ